MKKLVVGMLLLTVLLVGCTAVPSAPVIPPIDPSPTTVPKVVPGDGTYSDITYIEDEGIPILPEGFGIYGSQVEFEGVYPGWTGTVPLTIVNGEDRDRLFVVSLRTPSKLREGYEAFPQEYFYWITISEPEVAVSSGGIHQIPLTLTMPWDSDYTGKRAEVRIRIEDTTQTGLVQIALETKWFIITAD